MSAKKNELGHAGVDIDHLMDMNDALQAKNAGLELENGDLQKQIELLVAENVRVEDLYAEERKVRRDASHAKFLLEGEVKKLATQLQAAKELRAVERSNRHGSIPKFVIVAAIALVVMMASFMLQKLCAIGPSVGYGIQCGMSMVIAWCYAIIWDRSRK